MMVGDVIFVRLLFLLC